MARHRALAMIGAAVGAALLLVCVTTLSIGAPAPVATRTHTADSESDPARRGGGGVAVATTPNQEEAWIAWQEQASSRPHADPGTLGKIASTLHALDALGAATWATDPLAAAVFSALDAAVTSDSEGSTCSRRTVSARTGCVQRPSILRKRSTTSAPTTPPPGPSGRQSGGPSWTPAATDGQHEPERTRRRVGDVLVTVDVAVTAVTEALLETMQTVGGEVVHESKRFNSVRVHLPLGALVTIAAHTEVLTVRPGFPPERRSSVSEGVAAHNVRPVWQPPQSAQGRGVTVGVISDSASASRIRALQATGDLSDVYVLVGQEGPDDKSDEGAAMLEIVHDLAPAAKVIFATGALSAAGMAENILRLADAGCDVIVDDIAYDASPLHDKDMISDVVNQLTVDAAANGRNRLVYVSAVGNDGHISDAVAVGPQQSVVWEGEYAALDDGLGGLFHDWGNGSPFLQVEGSTWPSAISLWWSDPMEGSAQDYDLLLVNETHALVAASKDVQNGTQNPVEVIGDAAFKFLDFARNRYYLAIIRKPDTPALAEPRFLSVRLKGCFSTGTLTCWVQTDAGAGRAGTAFGHVTAEGALGIAAVPIRGDTPFSSMPQVRVANYSSDGPRRLFYGRDGRTLLVEDPLSGVFVRSTVPAFAGASGVTTSTPGFSQFGGTSAAAPHVAALIALIKSSVSPQAYLSRDGIVALLKATAQRIGSTDSSGYSPTGGWGLPNVAPVIAALQACPIGHYVDTSLLVCLVCPNRRAIPAGSAGLAACTDPSTLPGATLPASPPPTANLTTLYAAPIIFVPTESPPPPNTEAPDSDTDSLSGGEAAGVALASVAVAGAGGTAAYMKSKRRRRDTEPESTGDQIQLTAMDAGDMQAAFAGTNDSESDSTTTL